MTADRGKNGQRIYGSDSEDQWREIHCLFCTERRRNNDTYFLFRMVFERNEIGTCEEKNNRNKRGNPGSLEAGRFKCLG
jgi:hypothetical protein